MLGLVLAIAVVAFTYFSSEEQTVPVTGRTQLVAMSDEQQSKLGVVLGGAKRKASVDPEWASGLKRLYDQVVEEPLPDAFAKLLSQLDDSDKK